MLPPAALLQDCAEQAVPGGGMNNGELLALALDYRDALRACNKDKAALRAWGSGAK